MLPDNVGYLFAEALVKSPRRPAILQDDRVLTFEALHARSNRMANALRARAVGPGDRVALLFDNDIDFFEALFGPMRLGAVPVPLNPRASDETLAFIAGDSEASVLIANASIAARARRLAAAVSSLKLVVLGGHPAPDVLEYEAFVAAASPILERRRTDPDEICMQPYTSGSTGRPKGVLLTHGGQLWNASVMRIATKLQPTDRALVSAPLCHKNAMIGAVKPFLLAGGSLVILRAFDPVEVIRAIERHGVTYLSGVPAMYRRILAEKDALASHDISSVRFAKCGSAVVPHDLIDEFTRVFRAPMMEGYGLTEGGPIPITNIRGELIKRGSCGREIPGCDVRLIGADGTAVGANEVGELVTRNPGVARGYWRRADLTAEKFRDGWFHSGDLLRRDDDGYYYFVGRKDDLINVAGENVYPKEIEEILLRHDNVQDVCVVSAPHLDKGEVPVAFVVERVRGGTTQLALQEFFLRFGAAYAHPRRVYFVGALPLASTGKIDRAALTKVAHEEKRQHAARSANA